MKIYILKRRIKIDRNSYRDYRDGAMSWLIHRIDKEPFTLLYVSKEDSRLALETFHYIWSTKAVSNLYCEIIQRLA